MTKFTWLHRTLSSILAVALAIGSAAPSYALKPTETAQSGLEEDLRERLLKVTRAFIPPEPASPASAPAFSVRPEPVLATNLGGSARIGGGEGRALSAAGLEENPETGQLGWKTVVGAFVELYEQFRIKNPTLGEAGNRADTLVRSLLDPTKEEVTAGHIGLRLRGIQNLLQPFSEQMDASLETDISLAQALTAAQEAVAGAFVVEPNPSGLEEMPQVRWSTMVAKATGFTGGWTVDKLIKAQGLADRLVIESGVSAGTGTRLNIIERVQDGQYTLVVSNGTGQPLTWTSSEPIIQDIRYSIVGVPVEDRVLTIFVSPQILAHPVPKEITGLTAQADSFGPPQSVTIHIVPTAGLEEARNPFARGMVPPVDVLHRDRLNLRATDFIAAGIWVKGMVGGNDRDAVDGLGQDIFDAVHRRAKVSPHMFWFEGAKHNVYGEAVEYMVHEGGTTIQFPGAETESPVLADVTENTAAIIRGRLDKSGAGGTSVYLTGLLVRGFGGGKDEFGAAIVIGAVPPDKMKEFLPSQGGKPLDPDEDVIANVQRLLDANGIGWEDAEIFYQERNRSKTDYLEPLLALKKDYPGMGLTVIKDGTMDGGLLSILGRKLGKFPVFVGTAGSTEAAAKYLNALILENVVVGFRILSPFAKSVADAVGSLKKTLGELTPDQAALVKQKAKLTDERYEALPKDVPIRYIFTQDHSGSLAEVRPEDVKEITAYDPKTKQGGKLFHNETLTFPRKPGDRPGIRLHDQSGEVIKLIQDVRWDDTILSASIAILLESGTLTLTGPRIITPGEYGVQHLVLERTGGTPYVWVDEGKVTWEELTHLVSRHFAGPPPATAAGLEQTVFLAFDGAAGLALEQAGLEALVVVPTPTDFGHQVKLGLPSKEAIGLLWGGLEEGDYRSIAPIGRLVTADPGSSTDWQQRVIDVVQAGLRPQWKLQVVFDSLTLASGLEELGIPGATVEGILKSRAQRAADLAQMN